CLRPRKRSRTECASRGDLACASAASNAAIWASTACWSGTLMGRLCHEVTTFTKPRPHAATPAIRDRRARRCLREERRSNDRYARAADFAADFACFASDANAAGLDTASSDRLLRSSVTPAFFRP